MVTPLREKTVSPASVRPDPEPLSGIQCLRDPLRNKGTAFTRDERARLDIDGLLPPRVETLEEQAARALENVRVKTGPLEKYRYLSALQAENETLFYRVVLDRLEEMLPIIYTPTVGEACVEWSRLYERPRGLYISAQHRGRIAGLLGRWPRRRAGIIVVTDGGRILGLGDLGANGMGIPIGKLALYTACAGVPPELCLPVTLDVGTDNASLRGDRFYLGERQARMTGNAYDALLEEFVTATQAVFPGVIVQFEDFNNACAFRLLQRYRDRLCCFNDDVQGTGAMGLAGLYAAGRITGRGLPAQRILFVGAGEACLGIGASVVAAMQREGLSEVEARERCLFIDSRGLVVASRSDLAEHKRPFAQDRSALPDLPAAVEDFRPTVLIGACGQGGVFTQPVIEAMARLNERPVVFALSNPTSKAECTAGQAYAWSSGRAVFASGSPFGPVTLAGCTRAPAQGNNSWIFPGVGLGLLLSGARHVTDEMFQAAARTLAAQVSQADLDQGRIFPVAARMREVAAAVAAAVAGIAYEQGHATKPQPRNLHAEATGAMYTPRYA
ncbi:MAG: NAD-dependent malic enzyme [Betaproteobacteria bacterium]|nr:NAD-dependent malic enzyme [Betaproteobacteria bacterium]